MKNGKIANMPNPMNIIPIRSFLEGEMLSTLLAQKKKRIIPTIPLCKKLNVAASVCGMIMRVNIKVVPPRHAEKLAKKMPFRNTRNVGERDNKL